MYACGKTDLVDGSTETEGTEHVLEGDMSDRPLLQYQTYYVKETTVSLENGRLLMAGRSSPLIVIAANHARRPHFHPQHRR